MPFGLTLPAFLGGEKKKPQNFRQAYRLGRKLGEGAFGVVHECRKRNARPAASGEDEDPFAVKMIDRAESDTTGIEREVIVMGQLDHPNVCKCLDIFVEKCFVCIVMPKYSGGDLVDGLQLHLRTKGKIPEPVVADLSRQIFGGVMHMHDKGYIHRDIKGDNLLMDRQDLADPGCHLVLSDFGTCIQHESGKTLRQLTGTRVFWSPEVVHRRYSFPADVWACGVVVYGLINATFPFKDQQATVEKAPRIPPTVTPEGHDMIIRILEKNPDKRISLEQALKHPFLAKSARGGVEAPPVTATPPQAKPEAPAQGESAAEGDSVNRYKVPQAMALRRREMASKYGAAGSAGAGNQGNSAIAVTTSVKDGQKGEVNGGGVNVKLFQCQDFEAEGLHAGEMIAYKWFDQAEAEKQCLVTGSDATGRQGAKQFVWTPKVLKERLEKANISTAAFGQGTARSLAELCDEISNGSCSLMHDTDGSFTSNKIVRVVDVVLLRITHRNQILIEAQETFPDGRNVQRNRLPGTKQLPNENVKGTAERVLVSILGIQPKNRAVQFDYDATEVLEEKEDSPSYPGVITVYRKTIVHGNLLPHMGDLQALGGDKCADFQTSGPKGENKQWTWLTAKEVQKKNIKCQGKKESEEISGLVAAGVKMDEEGLKQLLEEHGIDAEKMYDSGRGEAKTLYEFAQELGRGESYLQSEKGKLTRFVDVVLLKLCDGASNKILLEVSRFNEKTGAVKKKSQLPGAKARPFEHVYATARRICNIMLNTRDEYLTFGGHTLLEEEASSAGYPGMVTVYRKHVIEARVEKEGY